MRILQIINPGEDILGWEDLWITTMKLEINGDPPYLDMYALHNFYKLDFLRMLK